jgi:hypothetical protein
MNTSPLLSIYCGDAAAIARSASCGSAVYACVDLAAHYSEAAKVVQGEDFDGSHAAKAALNRRSPSVPFSIVIMLR